MLAVNFEKKSVRALRLGEQPGKGEDLIDFTPFDVTVGCWMCEYFVESLVGDCKNRKYRLTCAGCFHNAAKAWEIQ